MMVNVMIIETRTQQKMIDAKNEDSALLIAKQEWEDDKLDGIWECSCSARAVDTGRTLKLWHKEV